MNMDARIQSLEKEVANIKLRNVRVEREKAWETSFTRFITVVLLTYFVMTLVFRAIGTTAPHINAVVPTLGFILSTVSLPFVKQWWIKRNSSQIS